MRRIVCGLFAAFLAAGPLSAQTTKPKHVYGHDVKVRPVGEQNFKADTPKVAVEFFHDPAANALLAISDSGSLAVVPFATPKDPKTSEWAFAHELRARKSTEETFTKDTKKFSVEAYKDAASGHLLYATDQRTIALGKMPKDLKGEAEPAFHHGLTLKARGPKETEFKNAKAFGVDVSKDGNTGGLIYISEIGSIAVGAAPPAPPGENPKKPKSLYGLTFKARKADEGDFTPQTRSFVVEVFEDTNSGNLVYLCETGSIAVAPAGPALQSNKGLRWSHAFTLKARKPGEKDFEKAAKYGVEAFVDQNSGHTVYICETGSIAVLATK
jgi:hypothetical protein